MKTDDPFHELPCFRIVPLIVVICRFLPRCNTKSGVEKFPHVNIYRLLHINVIYDLI